MALLATRNLQKPRAPHNADPSTGGAARSAAPPAPASAEGGSEFLQVPSRRDGCLARQASRDCDLP
eukprot:10722578-Alexandrium_andersonii.AAC.1